METVAGVRNLWLTRSDTLCVVYNREWQHVGLTVSLYNLSSWLMQQSQVIVPHSELFFTVVSQM